MKVDEHSKRLENFASEIDQKYRFNIDHDQKNKYKVSFRSRRSHDGEALSAMEALRRTQLDNPENKEDKPEISSKIDGGSMSEIRMLRTLEDKLHKSVKQYYREDENYHDDVPYDLYNMVEMYKQISKATILPNFVEIKKGEKRNVNDLSKLLFGFITYS